MDFTSWSFKNAKLVHFVIAVLFVGGLLAAWRMSKLEDPEIKVKMAMVVVTYPGASAHQVELEAVQPLENSIRAIKEVDQVTSVCYSDFAMIQVQLDLKTPEGSVKELWLNLRNKAAGTQLPPGASVTILDEFGDVYGMFYAMTGDGLDETEMGRYADLLKREITNVEGVGDVLLYGKRQPCIDVCLDEGKMSRLGVGTLEVLMTLNGQQSTTYSGYFMSGDRRVRVTVDNRFTTAGDIAEMIIQGHEDDQLRLRDIATVEKSFAEPRRNSLTYDGETAVGILVSAQSGTDILKVGKAVDRRIEEIRNTRLPEGVELHKVFYQPERVGDALGTFFVNLAESVLIVIGILMVFMGFRSGVIIGISLLLTVVSSIVFLYIFNGAMQRVSLAAFILAMGMLVDNAIVIVDGINKDLKAGKPRRRAMTDIGKQTAMPLLGATVIAIVAFLPLFLSKDSTGTYIRDLFIVLAISLFLSWLYALLQAPLLADRILGKGKEEKTADGARTEKALRSLLGFALDHRVGTVLFMVLLLGISLMGFPYMNKGFFPDMTYNQLYLTCKLQEGSDRDATEAVLDEIQDYLRSQDYITHITASVGGTPGRYNLVRSIGPQSMSYGELIVDFTSPKVLEQKVKELQDYMDAHFPEAYIRLKRYNLMYKEYPVEALFSGPDPAVLHELTARALQIMENDPKAIAPRTDWEDKIPFLNVRYDQSAARRAGFSRTDLSMSLLSATDGIPVGVFYDGADRTTINVKMTSEGGGPVGNLSDIQAFSQIPSFGSLLSDEMLRQLQTGHIDREDVIEALYATVPLRQLSQGIEVAWEDPVVMRFNGQRTQRAQCFPAFGLEASEAFNSIRGAVEAIPLPDGYSLEWQGEHAASDTSMRSLFSSYPLAVLLIIGLLILLFKDYRKPTIILLTVPMVMIGVIAAILVTGKSFGMVAIAGVLGLVGMIIKNGIVLMDEIDLRIARGDDPYEAIVDGSASRLTAVSMAAATTILGMIPLLGDALFGPLAACVMGGLLIGTILTLVFIPVLYSLFFRIRKKPEA